MCREMEKWSMEERQKLAMKASEGRRSEKAG